MENKIDKLLQELEVDNTNEQRNKVRTFIKELLISIIPDKIHTYEHDDGVENGWNQYHDKILLLIKRL